MSKRPSIHLLVTDLDNTLYDWVSSFIPPLYRMVEKAAEILDVNPEQLLDELKVVHQKYHNSEHPFALLETPTVEKRYPHASRFELKQELNEAFYIFNKTRKSNLKLYPSVRETLHEIRTSGCLIVAYTEAKKVNIIHRIKLLELNDDIRFFYTRDYTLKEHPDPRWLSEDSELINRIRILPQEYHKPDPNVLREICNMHCTPVENTLYVGDSVTRDIAMAKMAGTHSALAVYGRRYDASYWDKLVRVTHWTEEDVTKEIELQEKYSGIEPDLRLVKSIAELLEHFSFTSRETDLDSNNELPSNLIYLSDGCSH